MSSVSGPAVLVNGPVPQPPASVPFSPDYLSRAGVMCGAGATTSPVSSKPTLGCGVGFSFGIPLLFVEVGVMGPQANRSNLSGYVSVDADVPLYRPGGRFLPVAIVGYSRLFETGHSFDYGLALGLPKAKSGSGYVDSWRLELRDYWTFANPTQHNVMLRVGWMGPTHD